MSVDECWRSKKGEGDVNQVSDSCSMKCMLCRSAGALHWFSCFGTDTDAAGACGCLLLLLQVPPGTGNKDTFLSFTLQSPATVPKSSIQLEANWQESLENVVYGFLAPCNIEER